MGTQNQPGQTPGTQNQPGDTMSRPQTWDEYSKSGNTEDQDSLRQAIRSRYPDLTDDDFDHARGNVDQLVQAARRDSADDEQTIRQSINEAVRNVGNMPQR